MSSLHIQQVSRGKRARLGERRVRKLLGEAVGSLLKRNLAPELIAPPGHRDTTLDHRPEVEAGLEAGLPVLDDVKFGAYPDQRDVVESLNGFIRSRATDHWGRYENLLLDKQAVFNHAHFFGKLPSIHIRFGDCPPRQVLGTFSPRGDHGMLGDIVLNERMLGRFVWLVNTDETRQGFENYLCDVLLHEDIHAYCHLVLDEPENGYHGHGPIFTEQCNRIGNVLGYGKVRHSKSRKDEDLPRCNYWPACVAPLSRYGKALQWERMPIKELAERGKENSPNPISLIKQEVSRVTPSDVTRLLTRAAKNLDDSRLGRRDLCYATVAALRLLLGKSCALDQFPDDLSRFLPGDAFDEQGNLLREP